MERSKRSSEQKNANCAGKSCRSIGTRTPKRQAPKLPIWERSVPASFLGGGTLERRHCRPTDSVTFRRGNVAGGVFGARDVAETIDETARARADRTAHDLPIGTTAAVRTRRGSSITTAAGAARSITAARHRAHDTQSRGNARKCWHCAPIREQSTFGKQAGNSGTKPLRARKV